MGELVHAAEHASLWLANRLLAGSIQGGIVVGLVWLACWRIKSIPASARAALWWLAALKLVLALTSLPSIPVPVLPAADVPAKATIVAGVDVGGAVLPAVALPQAPSESPAPASPGPRPRWPWLPGAVALWTLGVALHAARLLAGWRRVRAVLARSAPIGQDDAALAARLAAAVGLKTPPDVRVSEEIDSPQVVRALRPVVLLPAGVAGSLTDDERAMAICHELVHVRRRDLLFGWVPACAERLFFFHPLARLAAREYVLAREAACDAAVLQALGVAPREYGQVLLRLGVSGAEPSLSATAASKSRSSLKRRLDMLQDIARETSRRSMWLAAALMAVAIVPVHLVARHAPPPLSEAASAVLTAPVEYSESAAIGASESPAQDLLSRDSQAQLKELQATYSAEVERYAAEIAKSAAAAAQAGPTERALQDSEKAKAEQAAAEERKADDARQKALVKAEIARAKAEQAAAEERNADDPRQKALVKAEIARAKALLERYLAEKSSNAQAASELQLSTETFLQQQLQEQSNLLRELERALNQLHERQAAERANATTEQRKAGDESSAVLRELERSLRQAGQGAANADAELARGQVAEETLRRLVELQGRLGAQTSRNGAETDRNASLNEQIEQLRRERVSLESRLQDLLKQRDALLETQRNLQVEMERLRAAIERAASDAKGAAAPKK